MRDMYNDSDRNLLTNCTLCPRNCRTDRFKGGEGYCGTDAGLNIASICIHRGEEPSISGPDGICNIFFAGCNLRCRYCQNYDISRPEAARLLSRMDPETLLDRIEAILSQGIKAVGFVSPSHVVPQVRAIIKGLHNRGLKPVTVYNTNGYDKQSVLQELEGLIDVYLPDFKYMDSGIASEYSDAPSYPEVALKALKEMYYQKGSSLILDEDGVATQGMLIRHLVLPGNVLASIQVLRTIAEELSTGVHISLMSQYHPTPAVYRIPDLGRRLSQGEYKEVINEMERLGFRNGWLQDPESYNNYIPDFRKDHPFES